MKIQAQISLYPLKTESLSEPIQAFCRILEGNGLNVKTQSMSSLVVGESQVVFKAFEQAFEELAKRYHIVMDLKVSNACPEAVNNKSAKELK